MEEVGVIIWHRKANNALHGGIKYYEIPERNDVKHPIRFV